ncbi:MAG TPA: serine/threonine-protein kinase [Myxococcus sp.]|nr:serine/threonine-protein kinase [Myxococcus sp.]
MNNLRKCPRCGSVHPSNVRACPRGPSQPVDPEFVSPYDDDDNEATLKRKPDSDPSPVAVRPLVNGAPSAYAEEEEEWERSVNRDVMVGKKLADYVVKRRIGAGGMGIVYEGEHPVIGRKVAIKILRPDFAEGGRARDLASEARAASAIRHRGIIDIFGFGSIPGVGQYLVMEYLDGLPLDEVINQRAPMLETEVVTVLDELLGALEAAHAVGVIHRDLKPGNVFIVRDGSGNESVKVLDFGLAKRSEAPYGSTPQTRQSMMVGTPEYMAPEQACGQQVGPHTDLYAVGVIAFEMLTRRLPFEGESPMAIAVHHVRTPPPPPSTYVELHPALESLVLRLLAKDAADRPPSAEAVRRELKGILKQLTSDATQLAPPPEVTVAATLSEETLAIAPPPAPRVRTERFGPQPRRPAPKGAAAPAPAKAPAPPRRATPVPAPVDLYADKTTAMDLEALNAIRPPPRSRAVMAAAGGVLLLGLLTGGALLLSSRDDAATPAPEPLQAGTALRALPPAPVQAPVPAPQVAVAPAANGASPEGQPAAGGEGAVPAAAVAKASEDKPAGSTEAAALTVKTERGSRTNRRKDAAVPGEEGARAETASGNSEASRPAARGVGTLNLVMKHGGWGYVFVNGKELGRVPPMNELTLPAGRHRVAVVGNPKMQDYEETITIAADDTTIHEVVMKRRDE